MSICSHPTFYDLPPQFPWNFLIASHIHYYGANDLGVEYESVEGIRPSQKSNGFRISFERMRGSESVMLRENRVICRSSLYDGNGSHAFQYLKPGQKLISDAMHGK
jgi:hypothetical protein